MAEHKKRCGDEEEVVKKVVFLEYNTTFYPIVRQTDVSKRG